MISVVAHPNIALTKYWGKRAGEGNVPAVPSLSVTLAGLSTRTRASFREGAGEDTFRLQGLPAEGDALRRAVAMFDRVRAASGRTGAFEVESHNDFPTASGLASSASGFAALALATTRAVGLDWSQARVADLARRSSASAARSVFGGYVTLEGEHAEHIASAEHLPLVVLVCVTSEGPKDVPSTGGMLRTQEKSPLFAHWLDHAPTLHARAVKALRDRDFAVLGRTTEESTLLMHATALAAGILYWNEATKRIVTSVSALQERGAPCFFTIDAGPHVKVFTRPEAADALERNLAAVPGVLRVLRASIGEGARVVAS